MTRGLVLGVLLAVVAAAPAGAQTVRTFEDVPPDTNIDSVYAGTDISFSDGDSCGRVAPNGGHDSLQYLETGCPPLRFTFAQGQDEVSFFATGRTPLLRGAATVVIDAFAFDAADNPIAQDQVTTEDGVWAPMELKAPAGAAIQSVELRGPAIIGIDDVTYGQPPPPPPPPPPPAPPPPVADRDLDGILDGADNCPDTANAGQGDGDKDGVGDACEILPSGNAPIRAGVAVTARVVSGEVFVKLPPGAAASAFTAAPRAPFQETGFLPLKGVAAVPVGSTVDARKGELALTAAVNGRPPGSRRQLKREARFAAGIFQIRQARAKRRRPKQRVPARAVLTSGAGAERPCGAGGPPKGVPVRALTTTAKGLFQTVGAASTAAPLKGRATFITTDRCDGTLTEVGRGRVAVIARRGSTRGERRTVGRGRAYFVKARLFAAKKGRRSGR